ncbi:MAG: hypothetical protein ACUVQY_09550 [Thermoproteota archaeon]
MSLNGKNAVIIVANEFEDVELLYPLLRLSEEGAKVIIVPVKSGLHPRPSAEKPVSGNMEHQCLLKSWLPVGDTS